MIISKYVNVKISNNQIKYYKNIGYDVIGGNEIKSINVDDLPNNSGQKITVKCDFCNNIKTITLNRYNINTKNKTLLYACSRKCAESKNKNTLKDKYNIDNISKLDKIKKLKIKTCLKNNNVEHPQKSNVIFNKSKSTKKLKYGNEFYFDKNKMKQSKKETLLLKYNAINYDNNQFTFLCQNGHNFKIDSGLFYNRLKIKTTICTICNPYKSNTSPNEDKLYDFIKNNYNGKIIKCDRKTIYPKELDIYIPKLNIAFEYNGLYWHNELNKDKYYHQNKTNLCKSKYIKLYHIFSDDWLYKQDVIKSFILKQLNILPIKRLTNITISELNNVKDFINENCLIEYTKSSIKIGLFDNNELLSVLILSKYKNKYKILIHCDKNYINIENSFDVLFSYFVNKYNPVYVEYNIDICYNNDFKKSDFILIEKTKPDFYYVYRDKKYNKKHYKYLKTLTKEKINKIYNCGYYKYIYKTF